MLAKQFLAEHGDPGELEAYVRQFPEDLAEEIRNWVLDQRQLDDLTSGGGGQTVVSSHPGDVSGGDGPAEWPDFADYRIIREIARGGMGIVYEAEQISLGRRVALKTLRGIHTPDSIAHQRFQIEARAAAQLHHSNIVPVYEVGQEQDTSFIAMQFIDGHGLDQVIRALRHQSKAGTSLSSVRISMDELGGMDGQDPKSTDGEKSLPVKHVSTTSNSRTPDHLSSANDFELVAADTVNDIDLESGGEPEIAARDSKRPGKKKYAPKKRTYWRSVARIGEQIAEALHYAHERGIIHRDVKPSNLILDPGGVVWISDFGLAKTEEDGLTKADDLVGTLMYMSPERFDGFCDVRSDIYSLGLTLYEMLALRPAFPIVDKMALLKRIRDNEPRRMRSIDPGIPRDLQTIVRKAMAKEPSRRYQTADAMAKDLGRFIEGRPIHARHVPTLERSLIWARRNPFVAGLTCALVLTAVAAMIGSIAAAIEFRQMAISQKQLAQSAILTEARAVESEQKAREAELAATAAAKRANEAASQNARNLYYAEMKLAVDAVADPNGVRQTRQILDRWIPDRPDDVERRGWEWYLLDAIANPKTTVLASNSDETSLDTSWSPAGDQIAWTLGSRVLVADYPAINRILVLGDHQMFVLFTRFSPDGRFLITGSADKSLRVWDWQQQTLLQKIDFETPPGAACWSPDGSLLAVQAFDRGHQGPGRLHLFHTADWTEAHRFDAPENNDLYRFCFDPTGGFLVTSDSRKIRVLETGDWKVVREKQMHSGVVVGLAWHPTKPWIATAARDGWSRIWNMEDDSVIDLIRGREQSGIDWHPSGDRLAIGNWDYGVRIFRPDERQLEVVLNGHAEWVNAVAWHPARDVLASCSSDGTMRIWDLATPSANRTFRIPDTPENLGGSANVSWSPQGDLIATEVDGRIVIRDALTGRPVTDWTQDTDSRGDSFSWAPDGESFAVRQAGEAKLWKRDGSESTRSATTNAVLLGEFSPADNRVVLVDRGNINDSWQLQMWNTDRGEISLLGPAHRGQHTVMPVWSPDASLLATGAAGEIHIVDSVTGEIVESFDESKRSIIALEWSPDGKLLALAGRDQQIVIRSTTTWQQVKAYSGHTYRVACLDWSPDGTRLASGSIDRTVRVWDTETGQSTIKLQHDSPVRSVCWSSDSRQLASISDDGVTKIWDATASYERIQESPSAILFDEAGITVTRH